MCSHAQKKDALFIKRSVGCIVNWQRTSEDNYNKDIIHIHGTADRILSINTANLII